MLRLPLSFSVKNLQRRLWRSLITSGGIAVIVFGATLMLSLTRGLEKRIDVTGEEQNLLVISKAGQNLMFSSVTDEEIVSLTTLEGLALDAMGSPLISPEIMHMSSIGALVDDVEVRQPLYVRGVLPVAYEVHKAVRIVEGNLPEDMDEILVGVTAHIKLGVPESALAPGNYLTFEGKDWAISGRFSAADSIIESEVWMDSSTLKELLRRTSSTFAVVRMESKAAADRAMPMFSTSGAIERYFKGWTEKGYYREFGKALEWIVWIALLMVVIITVAGGLIGANTMYTAVINRIREIATYRVLGFHGWEIMVSMLFESILLALVGGVVGIGLSLTLNGIPFKLSFGAFYLVVDGVVIAVGIGLSLLIGLIGGFLPVLKGLRMRVVDGLKHG